jgi:uncharacterized protein YndB with AHSA1/START domain
MIVSEFVSIEGTPMPDILHRLPIAAPVPRVFEVISTPAGLNEWWTLSSEGEPHVGATYRFDFGPGFDDWRGQVTRVETPHLIEWVMVHADGDWEGTVVAIALAPLGARTILEFAHRGWRDANEHFRTSSCCWASYLRVLRRYLEHAERVPYSIRLDV